MGRRVNTIRRTLKTLKKKFLNFASGRSRLYWKTLSRKNKRRAQTQLDRALKSIHRLKTRSKSKFIIFTRGEQKTLENLEKKATTLKSLLSARMAPTRKNLEARFRIQKYFNRFYDENTESSDKTDLNEGSTEGVIMIPKDNRYPLSKAKLKIPDSQIADPGPLPGFTKTIGNLTLPVASQIDIQYMIIPKIYALWKQDIDPATGNLRVYKYFEDIPEKDYQKFLQAIKDVDNLDLEDRIPILFHGRTVNEMDAIVNEEEQGLISGTPKIFQSRARTPNWKGYIFTKKFGDRGAGYIDRLLGFISSGREKVLKKKEHDTVQCAEIYDPDRNDQSSDRYIPLTTLKSNGCIGIINGKKLFDEAHMYNNPNILSKNFIIFSTEYYPIPDPNTRIIAKYFQNTPFIRNAFDNWGIEGIDILFLELLQVKYPELSIKISTYILNTLEFPYDFSKLNYQDNFILIDKEIISEPKSFTVLNPFTPLSKFYKSITEASNKRKLYGMSTYMAYIMKKKNISLWKDLFDSAGATLNLLIYRTLFPLERITIDYLQYLRFITTLQESNYNYSLAEKTYHNYLGDNEVKKQIISIYQKNTDEYKKQALFFQSLVDDKKQNDILSLLQKF